MAANASLNKFFTKRFSKDNFWDPALNIAFDKQQSSWSQVFVLTSLRRSKYEAGNGLHIALFDTRHQTVVNSGELIAQSGTCMGWYITGIEVRIGVTLGNGVRMPPSITSPTESAGGGTATTSSSAGWNASAGAMGEAPMGSIGYDASSSNSISRDYKNITFANKSDFDLYHTYNLTHSSGGDYNKSTDIFNAEVTLGSFYDDVGLYELDSQVTGDDLPIISQGWWPIPVAYAGLVSINVRIIVNGSAANVYSLTEESMVSTFESQVGGGWFGSALGWIVKPFVKIVPPKARQAPLVATMGLLDIDETIAHMLDFRKSS